MSKKCWIVIGCLVASLMLSNGYWAMKWLNLSLNEKMLSADASESESRASKLLELVEVLSQGKNRKEIEALLSSRYGERLWCNEDTINLPFVRFIYTGDSLESVSDQTQIDPGDKG